MRAVLPTTASLKSLKSWEASMADAPNFRPSLRIFSTGDSSKAYWWASSSTIARRREGSFIGPRLFKWFHSLFTMNIVVIADRFSDLAGRVLRSTIVKVPGFSILDMLRPLSPEKSLNWNIGQSLARRCLTGLDSAVLLSPSANSSSTALTSSIDGGESRECAGSSNL